MKLLSKNLLILASAGSGKTYRLGHRVIGLAAAGAEPARIVALTFTRKAAGEFADSVLAKLAEAAGDEMAGRRLAAGLGMAEVDFKGLLQRVVRALPDITLGTMDGFFARIVRAFQYELGITGGKFDLLEGPRAAAMADELLAGILGDTLDEDAGTEFFHAFRRATIGREGHGVLDSLRDFVGRWQQLYREAAASEWGPAALSGASPDDWPAHKAALAAEVRAALDGISYTDSRQPAALEKAIATIEEHVIGSGALGQAKGLVKSLLDAAASEPTGPLLVKFQKDFAIGGEAAAALRRLIGLAAASEMAAALRRTHAVREVVAVFDALCERRLRRNGLLGFDDVKFLMGEWARGEDARLRREAVDFRLDSRIDHWLLDEFQDTSRADWNGLQPLIDEAASDAARTLFIVGDRKQAIYGWRGGDVRLFSEVIERYRGGLEIDTMEESWRSCPEVLALVNRVCGDLTTLRGLFGEAAARWEWRDHVSAAPLATAEKRGEARVEIVGDREARWERLAGLLGELGVGRRAVTCGVLLRGNEQVRELADFLRSRDFDVIEEGRRQPAKDNPVGIAITQLLRWLANPADRFAREVLAMSPLAPALRAAHGDSWHAIWEGLSCGISRRGFAKTFAALIDGLWDDWSDFGRRRAGDLLAALAGYDTRGGVSAAEAADWLERLEIAQNPGVAAVQVMTIHKAKGLGFDVVVLPEIPDQQVPLPQYFEVAAGPGWLTETPPKWARALIPELRAAEERWGADQRYEAFCMLYVALTRAKRGLYVFLDTPGEKADPDRPTLANWLARSAATKDDDGVILQNGRPDWTDTVGMMPAAQPAAAAIHLPPAPAPQPGRLTPSKTKAPSSHSASGMRFGAEFHALLEQVGWTDESPPRLPATPAGEAVAAMLRHPACRGVFERQGRPIELFREQAVDAILDDGSLLSGVIDRLHLHRDAGGTVRRIEIIDFKTDAVAAPAALVERHAGQLHAYRAALQRIHPQAEISCLLLWNGGGKPAKPPALVPCDG